MHNKHTHTHKMKHEYKDLKDYTPIFIEMKYYAKTFTKVQK